MHVKGKGLPDLFPRDFEVCGVRLGMTQADVKHLKKVGARPAFAKEEGFVLSYIYGGLASQKVEAYESDKTKKVYRMTGWKLRCPKLNLTIEKGQPFNEGLLLKQALGAPDSIDCGGTVWSYKRVQLKISLENDRFDIFVVGQEPLPK